MHIKREQVRVLPNFSMTDYASQGRTRPNNVVELGSCRTHQGYYTALSRSSSAEGTVIVQGLEQTVISGNKPSGHLRQEFRELELLDEITWLCYIGRLPPQVCGEHRNKLIRSYQKWKGVSYVPKGVHKAL
jgi:hypothetical protein